MKAYLGITVNDYDAFLTEQINIVSAAIEGYCGRKFNVASYIQKFYKDDFEGPQKFLETYHYPITALTSVEENEEPVTDYRLQTAWGRITNDTMFFLCGTEVEISYSAGYAVLPYEIKSVVYSLVEEKYNRKISGVPLNFGNDVQRIAIPGTISVDFDYSLNTNERKNKYGMILGNYLNVLDSFRSSRVIIGDRIAYVS